jgi:hypothetical protein
VDLDRPVGIAFVVIVVMMTVAVGAMHMAMGDFLVCCGTYFSHIEFETQCHARQRMIAIQNNLVIGNIGELALPAGWLKVNVKPDDATLFSLSER